MASVPVHRAGPTCVEPRMTDISLRRTPGGLRRRGVLAAALALALPAARAATFEGQSFPDTVTIAGDTLRLNGLGLRAVAWLKGYVAGLYLGRPASTPQDAVSQPGAKRLTLRMLQEAPTTEFIKAVDKGVSRNTPAADRPALAARVQQWNDAIASIGKVRPGDTVNLDYVPGRGMTMTHNGAVRGATIPGDDFYAAVLRIFLGDRPADARLKAGLLGLPPR